MREAIMVLDQEQIEAIRQAEVEEDAQRKERQLLELRNIISPYGDLN